MSPLVTEVLIVDDGSTDGTNDVIAHFSATSAKVRILENPGNINRGAHARLNQLVKEARNNWLSILNSDDEFPQGRFEAVERVILSEDFDLIFGDLSLIDGFDERIGLRKALDHNEFPWPRGFDPSEVADVGQWLEILLQQNLIGTTSNIVFNKSIFTKIGGFHEYRFVHDWDFVLRSAILGRIGYCPLMISKYRIHAGNTIRADRALIEAEVQKMFAAISAQFGNFQAVRLSAQALEMNHYLHPLYATWLEIVEGETTRIPSYALPGVDVVLTPTDANLSLPYIYAPGEDARLLTENDLRNIRLSIAVRGYDAYVISRATEFSPVIGATAVRDCLIYQKDSYESGAWPLKVRAIRLLPSSAQTIGILNVFSPGQAVIDSAISEFDDTEFEWPQRQALSLGSLYRKVGKPVVFIFPAFLALGGAERLVLETMRFTAGRYKFVIINTEPLLPEQGSLHHEAFEFADVYEIAETVRLEDRLKAIEILRNEYKPSLMWITNGSPWQVSNAAELRSIFSDIPIVDNQVYDHEMGWINSFDEPGMLSANRFIAVNSRIRDVMVEKYGIDEDRIDLVYHGAKISDWRDYNGMGRRLLARKSLGLPLESQVFGMIGRLTLQKRPQDLIQLASRVLDKGGAAHFIWVGPGELHDEVLELAQRRGATNFHLFPSTSNVEQVYEALDGLIITSEFEGLPFVMLEALALGVPILSTPVGAIQEVLDKYGSGMISGPPGDVDLLEERFSEFAARAEHFREAAWDQRTKFIDQFCAERMAMEYERAWIKANGGQLPVN